MPIPTRSLTLNLARERLQRVRSHLNLQIVKKYRDKHGVQRVVARLQSHLPVLTIDMLSWIISRLKNGSSKFVCKAGGKDLTATAEYPMGLGLKAWQLVWVPNSKLCFSGRCDS